MACCLCLKDRAVLNRIHISTSPFPESLQYCFASLQPGQLLHPGAQKVHIKGYIKGDPVTTNQPHFPQPGAQNVHIKGYIKGDNTKSSSLSPESLRYYLLPTSWQSTSFYFLSLGHRRPSSKDILKNLAPRTHSSLMQ